MMPQQNGVYLAKPIAIALEEKQTGTVQAGVSVAMVEYRGMDGKAAEPVDYQMTGYFNLVKKDGTFNEINIRSLQESFGWSVADGFSALESLNLADALVQVVVADGKDQNGNTRKEMKYINPKDYAGSPTLKSAPGVAQSLDAKYGAKLRAIASKLPTVPNKPASGKPGTLDSAGVDTAKQVAYAKYISKVDEFGRTTPQDAYTAAERPEVFKKLATEFASSLGKEPRTMLKEDWALFAGEIDKNFAAGPRSIVPF